VKTDILQNGFVEPIESEKIAPLLNIDITSNENIVDSSLDVIEDYQYKPFNSDVPLDPYNPYDGPESLNNFCPDLLESYDTAKECDENHSIYNIQKLPDIAFCPILIDSPDSSKDDCTISSEIQSLKTSEICDVDSTNADFSEVELYKCLQETEEQDLSINYNGSNSIDIITPHSELSNELIAEKPLICDDSLSETKDTLSSEISNELVSIDDHDKHQEDINEQLQFTEDEKIILEDSSNLDVSFEESRINQQLEKELENILEISDECEVTKDKVQKDLYEPNDIPNLSIISDSCIELESEHDPIQALNHEIENESLLIDCNNRTIIENDKFLSEPEIECIHSFKRESTDSCSLDSTETILIKDDSQGSINTVTDSLDSQSTCSLPSEIIKDTIENVEDNHIQRPSTLNLNGTTNCQTELPSTLSTGMF